MSADPSFASEEAEDGQCLRLTGRWTVEAAGVEARPGVRGQIAHELREDHRLREAADALLAGGAPATVLAKARAEVTAAGFALDYLELRDAASLAPLEALAGSVGRLLVAARIGKTRLIDNIAVTPRMSDAPKSV